LNDLAILDLDLLGAAGDGGGFYRGGGARYTLRLALDVFQRVAVVSTEV
jgi:hypothetical protein